MADQARLRQLKIKTGILKRFGRSQCFVRRKEIEKSCLCRLGQERTMNVKEIDQQLKHIERMRSEGRDEYDLRKQVAFIRPHEASPQQPISPV
jgi:hypothetical protein